jgi:predicted dehydrogenase
LWQIKRKNGGGALSVSGYEMLDLALWLTGDEPVSVSGRLFHRFPESPDVRKTWFGSRREFDAEDLAIALVKCRESVVVLEADLLCSADDFGVAAVGTKGQSCTSPFRMEVASEGEFVDMTPTFFPETSAWYEQVKSFVDASLGRGKPFPAAEEALRVQRLADAIRRSSECGREIRLSDA